jgi:hypothetical protein
MIRMLWSAAALAAVSGTALAQECYPGGVYGAGYYEGFQGAYDGAGSLGAEPLFPYDDPEPWKHGYLQIVPYYGGYRSGRPYNYHHVFSQTQTSVGWGMPHGLPYSQQWHHRYEGMADPGRALSEPGGYYRSLLPQPYAAGELPQQPQMLP